MKKIFILIVLTILLGGCTSLNIPNYIQDKHPYKRKYYAAFDELVEATKKSLEDLGWEVAKESDPKIYERSKISSNVLGHETLLFTEMQQNSFVIVSKYSKVNVMIYTGSPETTEVEIRYLKISSIPFKSFYDYKNDKQAQEILTRIEENLNSRQAGSS